MVKKNTQTRDYSLFIITTNKSTVEQKAKNNQKITNTSIIPNGLSDHDAVTATIQKANTSSNHYWKLNTSILKEMNFQKLFQLFWKDWQTQKHKCSS